MIVFEELENDYQQLFIDFYRKEGLNILCLDEIEIYDIEEVDNCIRELHVSNVVRMCEDYNIEDFGWVEIGSGFFIKYKK